MLFEASPHDQGISVGHVGRIQPNSCDWGQSFFCGNNSLTGSGDLATPKLWTAQVYAFHRCRNQTVVGAIELIVGIMAGSAFHIIARITSSELAD